MHIYLRKGWLPPGVASDGSPRKPYNALPGPESPAEKGLGDPGVAGPLPGHGASAGWPPRRQGWPGIPQAKCAVKAPPRPLRSGLGEKRPQRPRRQPGEWEDRGAAARKHRARRTRRGAGGGAAGRRGLRDPGLRRPSKPPRLPGRDPGKALAPEWRPPRGRSVDEPVDPEARSSRRPPRGCPSPQPCCAARMQFDRSVPGRPPKATAARTERPKEKRGMGWGRGPGARKRCHFHQLGSFLTQPLICQRCLIPVIYICL